MKRFLIILMVTLFSMPISNCATVKDAEAREGIYVGYINSSCNNMEAIKELVIADIEFFAAANAVFQKYMFEQCGRHIPARWVPLEKKMLSYEDHEGKGVEVWKIYANDLYAIIRVGLIKRLDDSGKIINDVKASW